MHFVTFIVIWDSLIPDSTKNTTDPDPTGCRIPDPEAVIPDPTPICRPLIPDSIYSIYILLTKSECRTGRISAPEVLTLKRPRADILPIRSRASLVNKRFITRLKRIFNYFINITFCIKNGVYVKNKK